MTSVGIMYTIDNGKKKEGFFCMRRTQKIAKRLNFAPSRGFSRYAPTVFPNSLVWCLKAIKKDASIQLVQESNQLDR